MRRNPATGQLEPIHDPPVAVEIFKGPICFHYKCACGARVFFSRKWTSGMGMKPNVARKHGFVVQ